MKNIFAEELFAAPSIFLFLTASNSHIFSGTILISVIYRRQPDCSPTGLTMTQRLIGIYPEVAMVPQAILAVFDDNFGKQRRVQVGVHYVKSRTEVRALRHT